MGKKALGQRLEGRDLRLELKVKNNILWHAIFEGHRSVNALCRAHPELRQKQSQIGDLLGFKKSPFRRKQVKPSLGSSQKFVLTDEYRPICLALERVLNQAAEDLFPAHLYAHLVDWETTRVVEVSSFSALPSSVRREIRALPAPVEQGPEAMGEAALLRHHVRAVVNTLPRRERRVIELYFGLVDGQELTLVEIAEQHGVSYELVRQIYNRAIRKLQHPVLARRLRPLNE